MSLLTRLFKKPTEEDYESVLAVLARDIQKRQHHLSEIRIRERRATLLVTLYTLAAWFAYVSLWYYGLLPGARRRTNTVEKAVKGVPVVIGPVFILFIRRIVQIWYTRKGDAEEKTLEDLRKQQRTKVEEIKKKTNFYSMRDLLQRYDDSQSQTSTPRVPLQSISLRGPPGAMPSTPVRNSAQVPNGTGPTPQSAVNNLASLTNSHLSPQIVQTPRKQWYDKLADALLGDDGESQGPPSSRYALICEKCFKHNGLVKESMWEDVQYTCPKCNHFNASARSKKLGYTVSPSPPLSAAASPLSAARPLRASQSPNMADRSRSPSVSPSRKSQMRSRGRVAERANHDAEEESMMEVDSAQ